MRIKLLIPFILLSLIIKAQSIIINPELDVVDLDHHVLNFEDKEEIIQIEDYNKIPWQILDGSLDFGPNKYVQWLKFDIENNQDTILYRYLFIPYNHIHEIKSWSLQNGNITTYPVRGSMYSFKDKYIKSMGYSVKLELKPKSTSELVVRINHKNRPLRANMFLVSKEKLDEIIWQNNSLNWLWRGVFLFALIISLIIFIFTKLKIFLNYFLLNLAIAIYLASQFGDLNFFFNSDPYDLTTLIDFIGAFGVSLYFPLFLNTLTPVKDRNPILWKMIMVIVLIEIPIIFLNFFPSIRLGIAQYYSHIYVMIVAGLVIILQPILLIKNMILKDKNALSLFIIYSFYVFSVLTSTTLPNMGLLPSSPYIYNSLLFGSMIEIFTFLILMGRESLIIYQDRLLLREKQKQYQKELIKNIIAAQEEERNRAGRELHDSIGANMAIISRQINQSSKELKELVNKTIKSIRNLSHGLVSPAFSNDEFIDELKEICHKSSNSSMMIHPFFYNWPSIKNKDVIHHIYRIIQELLQNAIKHSQASEIHIQFSGENQTAHIMYEDNGIGFNAINTTQKGIGLRNIYDRLELINGQINIDSDPKTGGTTIIIEIRIS